MPVKICSVCKTAQPLDNFNRRGAKPPLSEKLMACCKSCLKAKYRDGGADRMKVYYQKNREKIIARVKARKNNNPDHNSYMRDYHTVPVNRARALWYKIKHRNKSDSFDIPLSRIVDALILGRCEQTNVHFVFESHETNRRHPLGPSVDKINPFGDYTLDNIQIVCLAYNVGKAQMSDEEYASFCQKVVESRQHA